MHMWMRKQGQRGKRGKIKRCTGRKRHAGDAVQDERNDTRSQLLVSKLADLFHGRFF